MDVAKVGQGGVGTDGHWCGSYRNEIKVEMDINT